MKQRPTLFQSSRRRSREEALDTSPAETFKTGNEHDTAESRIDCARAMQRLSSQAQELISLRYWVGCSSLEIAGRSGLAEASIDQTSRRALGRLRRCLGAAYSR